MTNYLLSIDPGLSTGVSLISYEEGEAPVLELSWQFGGGADKIKEFIRTAHVPLRFAGSGINRFGLIKWDSPKLTVIAEKFTARNTKGFSYTTASLEALRGEGVLLALDLMPDYSAKEKRWRDPGLQYLVGGVSLADKKKRQHKFLKDSGFYRTGKDFGTPDADDFRSSVAHGLNYLARELKHKPTFQMISDWVEEN